jgi:hypothetical protein
VETTPGCVAEAEQVVPLLAQHENNTQRTANAVVADRGVGTVETYCQLVEQGVRPYISPMMSPRHKSEGRFTKEDFLYDAKQDRYVCPAGQTLRPKRRHPHRQITDYVSDRKICSKCPLRERCTDSKLGRSVARHWKEETLEIAQACARLPEAYTDRRRRRHLMEGSFAQAANKHHFKRSRWRRLWRQKIQDWLIAAVQNIAILCGGVGTMVGARRKNPPKCGAAMACPASFALAQGPQSRFDWLYAFIVVPSGQTIAA